jgi:DNA-binding winged helix-turn-helix (wHTH) protein
VQVRFGAFSFDSGSRQLLRDGTPLHLSRTAFDALTVLIGRRPGAVTKDELHARLWPGTYVVDANLTVVVAEIRRTLGDNPQAPRFIRTIHRIGYAFCGESADEDRSGADDDRLGWLLWNDRRLVLRAGESVIGRDPECAIWIDAAGVSRRHARIHVSPDAATIEDLGSKNGTFVNDAPVRGPQALSDGDRVRLGPVQLDYRTRSSASATETVRLSR